MLCTAAGDGRALLLGEIIDVDGQLRDLHLKGSGRTPFARGGDGLAAVGPMLREYLVSEAMFALGIPTTRSLAVVATGRPVCRETLLPGRCSPGSPSSHLRVGSFQYAAATGDIDLCAAWPITRSPATTPAPPRPTPVPRLLRGGGRRAGVAGGAVDARGFVHGVMNTDNMTISGETIDYGPCAFMDTFDPATVYSSIDTGGRYAYGNQPIVAQWNLARFAEALLPLLHDDPDPAVALAVEALGGFPRQYSAAWSAGMRAKLGLHDGIDEPMTTALINELLTLLHTNHVDLHVLLPPSRHRRPRRAEPARELFLDLAGIDAWLHRWRALAPDADVMDRVESDLHPSQPPRRGSPRRRDRRRSERFRTAPRRGDRPLRPAPRARAVRRPRSIRLRRLPHLLRHLTPTHVAACRWLDSSGAGAGHELSRLGRRHDRRPARRRRAMDRGFRNRHYLRCTSISSEPPGLSMMEATPWALRY